MANKTVNIKSLGRPVTFVPRAQLRRTKDARAFTAPGFLKALTVPTPPASFDTSKGGTITYPLYGNDRWGDCFYVSVCNITRNYTGQFGNPVEFVEAQLVARYQQLSGGDNGLSDQQMIPEWKHGVIGPNGPHKILDELMVNPADDNATALAMWAYNGLIYTAALPDAWVIDPKPGDIWDVAQPNESQGHAMTLTGKAAAGYYELQTWGFKPPIKLTPAGLKNSDPELIVGFSLEMFDSKGIAPNGMGYDDLAQLWRMCGGIQLPANPFVAPPPTPVPVPPPTPVPVPPTPGPTPTPTPVPPPTPPPVGPTVQQRIDAIFAALEAYYGRYPYVGPIVVQALELARMYVESYLKQNLVRYAVRRVDGDLAIVMDASFADAMKARPEMIPVLVWLQRVVGSCLPLM